MLPSPKKTPVPLTCQVGPGFDATRPPPIMLVPLMSHNATDPSSFCRTMSVLPSPKKTPVPLTCQVGPGSTPQDRHRYVGAAHVPQRDRPIVVLKDDVGVTVVEEIARTLDVPGRPRVRRHKTTAENGGAAHVPQRDRPVVVL